MAIKNQDLFTGVDFFAEDEFELIGECAGQKLLLVGRAKVYGDPIVAISQSDEPSQEDLSACDLYELMKFGQNPINLTAALWGKCEAE